MNGIEQTVDAIAAAAERAIPIVGGDYVGENGLYYCGKCNTPKQCVVTNPFTGGTDVRHCLCKCAIEDRDREDAAALRAKRSREIEHLRRAGFPDEDMRKCTFAADDLANTQVSKIAHRYVENFATMLEKGKGLLLYGGVGTGKTFIAACIANAIIDKGCPCLVTDFARLTNTLSGMFDGKQDYIDGLNNFKLLVIDDLAAERDTEYVGEIVHTIINSRYRAGLPLIVTTNLTAAELKAPADMRKQRIYSRLFEMCIPVEVKGADRRRERLKTDYGELSDLLGL